MPRLARLAAAVAIATLVGAAAHARAAPPGAAAIAAAKREATAAAKAWLALVDDARYAESWTQASSLFREKLAQEQWVAMVRNARSGLGPLRARSLESAEHAETEHGTLVVLVWKSAFQAVPAATEQVTMLLDSGAWRCAGYFVRPR